MEIIKRKIALDTYRSKNPESLGQMTATTFNINVFFTQDADDMGIGTELPFISKGSKTLLPNNTDLLVDYTLLNTKLSENGYKFEYMKGITPTILKNNEYLDIRYPDRTIEQYYINGFPVTGLTEDRLDEVTSYDKDNKFNPGFDIEKNDNAKDYKGSIFKEGTRVLTNNKLSPITYIINGDVEKPIKIKTDIKRGIYFYTTTATTRTISNGELGVTEIPYTEMYYNSEGFNETNSHLSATTKEEYLFGITSTPTVFSDLFIDRGRSTVIQSHMQLGEIRNMSDLINYGNGFYNL